MNIIEQLKKDKIVILSTYGQSCNVRALWQTINTVVPYFLLFYIAIEYLAISIWISLAASCVLILFLMRVFMMMHDCGHNSLYKSCPLNKFTGFIMGVLCGIPQYVWSKHHAFHHATNGNWNKYQGPLSIISTEDYAKLSPKQQRSYKNNRNIWMAPLGGFMYFIFNPRFTWIKGSLDFAIYLVSQKLKNQSSLKEISASFTTRYWSTWKEYRHMTANNIVLLSAWYLAGSYFGWANFFIVYIAVISLSGALGIILFTIQHNFEDSYASGDEGWDYHQAALEGTSYLDLPRLLHWFTADIGYHHVHHLHTAIPNYNLVKCHKDYSDLFHSVKRVKLSEVGHTFKHILWDKASRKLVSIKQYKETLNKNN